MKDDLKMLVVGGGSAGVRHFRYLSQSGLKCSVCDPAESCRVTREFPGADCLQDFDSADLGAFDAVVICTPPFLHVPQAIAAARAGCHVLLEKPISVSEEGLDELEETVREKGLVAGVAFPYANMLAMDRVREIVRSGEIGDLWMVAAHDGQNILKARPDYYSTYYVSDAQGGGALQDAANHNLMAMELLCGPVAEVTAQRHNIGLQDIDTDDTCFVWLEFKSGVTGTLDYSVQCHFRHSQWIISGSKGAIHFALGPEDMTIQVFDAATENVREEVIHETWNETFRRNDENFVAAIRGHTSVRCTLARARACLRTVLAAKESARLSRPVRRA